MKSENPTSKINLDWSKLLGFDQADRLNDKSGSASTKLGGKVGDTRLTKVGGKVGTKFITGAGLRAPL